MSENLKFDDPVILVGGANADLEFLKPYTHLPIVAADGGANKLRRYSLVPHAVIGDLDSVTDIEHWQSVSKVIEVSEQDTTDFEKCLYLVDAPLFMAAGFSGNRLDHTLAALHVMQKLHQKKQVVLVGDDDVVCVCSDTVEISLPVGTRVSIYPLNRIAFESSSGLLYPLNDLIMRPGEMIGTSNVSNEPRITIVPRQESLPGESCYALILPSTHLSDMAGMLAPQVPAI